MAFFPDVATQNAMSAPAGRCRGLWEVSLDTITSMSVRTLVCALALHAITVAAQQHTPTTILLPLCATTQLTLTRDDQDGDFNGMQQSGNLLVLRNISHTACGVRPNPKLTLFDRRGRPLPVTARVFETRGAHSSTVLPPITIAPGAMITATMRWVFGPVFGHNVFLRPLSLSLSIEGQGKRIPFEATICGERGRAVSYTLTRFAPDPTYKPGSY